MSCVWVLKISPKRHLPCNFRGLSPFPFPKSLSSESLIFLFSSLRSPSFTICFPFLFSNPFFKHFFFFFFSVFLNHYLFFCCCLRVWLLFLSFKIPLSNLACFKLILLFFFLVLFYSILVLLLVIVVLKKHELQQHAS